MNIIKSEVANALTSAAANHVVAVAQDIFDQAKQKYQSDINTETLERLLALETNPSAPTGDGDIPKDLSNIKGTYHVKITDSLTSLDKADTNYVINYSHDLSEETWTIPEGSILTIEGGSIENGTLIGNNTVIDNSIGFKFKNVLFKGTWNILDIYPEWFKDPNATDNLDVYWNNALQTAINLSGYTKAPVKLTADTYMLYNWLRVTGPGETDKYDTILTIASHMTIYSDHKSRIKVLPLEMSNSQFYCSVFGHRYEGTSAYNKNTRWTNITLRNIIIDNWDDTLASSYTATQIINKYCFYAYNISNLVIEDCEMYCSGSNCVYIDISYKTESQRISDVRDVANNAVIRNNYFRIKEKQKAYDLSGLFVAMNNVEFYDNVVEHHWQMDQDTENDHWGCGGLEIHGPNFYVHDNHFIGFTNGINDCNFTGEPGQHLICDNLFEDCKCQESLWSLKPDTTKYPWTNYQPLQSVKFIRNTCINCTQPVRIQNAAAEIKDIVIKDNTFELSRYTNGGTILLPTCNGIDITFEGNLFKNCPSHPFLEAWYDQSKLTNGKKMQPLKIRFHKNKFVNPFCYEDYSLKYQNMLFFYYIPDNPDGVFELVDNEFELEYETLHHRVSFLPNYKGASRYKANYVIENNKFTKAPFLYETEFTYGNGLTKNNPANPDSHAIKTYWSDETRLYYAAAPITLNPLTTESKACTIMKDGSKSWCIKFATEENFDLFRVGDFVIVRTDTFSKYGAIQGKIKNFTNTATGVPEHRVYMCGTQDVDFNSADYKNKFVDGAAATLIVQTGEPSVAKTFIGGKTDERPTKPIAGCNYYDTETKENLVYDGSKWVSSGSGGGGSGASDGMRKYDTASIILGSDYRMPSSDEFDELIAACNISYVADYENTGVSGTVFTLKTDTTKTLFFPLGDYWVKDISNTKFILRYRSSTTGFAIAGGLQRNNGANVRAVTTLSSTGDDNIVNMGLSVNWCKYNVGAESHAETFLYAFGEYKTKDTYTTDNYYIPYEAWGTEEDELYLKGNTTYDVDHASNNFRHITYADRMRWDNATKFVYDDIEKPFDAASNILGAEWSMPTEALWEELMLNTTKEYDPERGLVLTSTENDASIVLPIIPNVSYWSAKMYSSGSYCAVYKPNVDGTITSSGVYRYTGHLIRPVTNSASEEKAVDLGFESGTKWCSENLMDNGLFAFGEIYTKDTFTKDNYYISEDKFKTEEDVVFEKGLKASVKIDHKQNESRHLNAEQVNVLKTALTSANAYSKTEIDSIVSGLNSSVIKMLPTQSDLDSIDPHTLEGNFYTFFTTGPCLGTPWSGKLTNIYATGFLYKTSGDWFVLIYRGTAKSKIYRRYYDTSKAPYKWSDWLLLGNSHTDLGNLETFDVDLTAIEGDTAAYYVSSATDDTNPPFPEGKEAGGTFGLVYKVADYWYQTAMKTFPSNAGVYIRKRNIASSVTTWEDWRRCDNTGTGGITESPIERISLSDYNTIPESNKDLTIFVTTASPENSPFDLPESIGCYAEGIMYKVGSNWHQTTWRGNQKGTNIYARMKLSSRETWDPWVKVNDSTSDLGVFHTFDIPISGMESSSAKFIVENFEDDSSPWGDTGSTGTAVGELTKIKDYWYEKVYRIYPHNKGTYVRRKLDGKDADKNEYPWEKNWVKIDADVDLTQYAKTADLKPVAFSGKYSDLEGTPTIPEVPSIQILTQAQYDALANPDSNTLYFIKG